MCTPCFCPSLRHQQSSSSGGPAPRQRHSTGILTVRRPRETIPVNFRVVVNFDIAIDAAKSSGGRIGRVSGVSRTGGVLFCDLSELRTPPPGAKA